MEQDCVAGLYQYLGMSVGAEFSSEDVSLLYRKVFHVPSNTDEAHTAMKKIAGGDNNWSCAGENILDVLLEMEREREKREKLYWNLQLLNAGNLNTPYMMDKQVITDPQVLNCQHQSTDPNTPKKSYNSGTGSLHSRTTDADSSQMGRLVGENELCGSVRDVKRLKKAARQCWIKLASEGVQSILSPPRQDQSLRVKGQAWGCVSLSDVLLLVEVKYDVMTHLLYTEMLQEHHTPSVWETLLPWQQQKEEEGLEDLAEEALESGDMLRLAELPGAFRMYRACLGACFRSCPESRELSWSAAWLLYELHTSRQQEKDTLTVLGEGLDGESLRLLCLYIRLATLRAQREKMSYSALLAARQSWETWPHVNSPCRAEQAALWLRGEEEEREEDLALLAPQQQAVLQLLVLIQEQERRHLVRLVHGVSLEDLQGPGCTVSPKEDSRKQTVLRNGCVKRLRQIHASLQTHNETQSPLEQTNSQSQLQPQLQAHICSKPGVWSQHQLEDCALLLLTHLLELQEVQACTFLPVLMDKNAQHLQDLRHEYESELRVQHSANLRQLLISDAPLTSGSVLIPNPNWCENSSNEQKKAQSCSTGPVEEQNISAGPTEVSAVVSLKGAGRGLKGTQVADVTDKQEVCTGCGAVMEEMPYLEILCLSDATNKTHQSLTAEGGPQEEENGSATRCPQSSEETGSLITLAWSKPPEAANGGTGQNLDSESSLRTQVQPSDMSSTTEYTQCEETSRESFDEELKATGFQSGSTSRHDAQSASEHCSPSQFASEERTVGDQPQRGDEVSGCDLQTHVLLTETLQAVQPHPDDPCSGLTREMAEDGRDWPEFDRVLAEGEAMREFPLLERARVREPVSAMERERTMRNLVDMQRKVEQRQKRDRDRQLLRVQERLSIIQNRKAEEDLLGLKHEDRLRHLTRDLPQEDKNQQKTVVKERLEQLRRERSYVMQSKRNRNTTGFKELLGPVVFHTRETEDGAD